MTRMTLLGCTALLAASVVGACASTPPAATLPTTAFGIEVRKERATLRIPIDPDQQVLNYEDKADLEAFARAYHDRGHGKVSLALPVNSDNNEAVMRALTAARDTLHRHGIRYEWMDGERYNAQGQPGAPLVAMFTHYEAIAPDCFARWGDFGYTQDQPNTTNFGCASQANLARMVADPRDLLMPRDLDPADGLRRSALLEKYRAGESTVTQRDDNEQIAISDAVQ